ncbi:hypothetical protein J6590_020908 [Homalodisca vitripennis]|nr:hypothetical protein J6590_020908 [Homalodisca vitripennis]
MERFHTGPGLAMRSGLLGVNTVLLPLLRVFGSRLILVAGAEYCSGGTYRRLVTEVHKAEYGNTLSSSTPHHFSSVFAYGASRSHRSCYKFPTILVIWRSGGNASSVCIAELCSADLALACSTLFLPL